MNRLTVASAIGLMFGAVFSSALFAQSNSPETPPNIVVLLADDLGWNAVGYHNERFKTPHLDRLAASGMTLNRFYVAPMCSPTRAGLMTGRYPIRFGMARAVIPPYRDFGLPPGETTIAERLGELGYQRRGVFGKWHLGHRRGKWHPLNQGFTDFVGHYNGAIDYFELTREGERDWHRNATPSDQQGYSTDLIAEAACEFIRDAAAAQAPYFCYVPFNAPHSPFQAPQRALDEFRELENLPPRNRRRAKDRKTYAAMIWQMDKGIGKILEAVEQTGEADQTLIWFFSDNGGVGGIAENNDPLRGSKLTVYEGGIRVPACVRWPGKVPAGSTSDNVMGYIDLFPTCVSLAGGQPDGDQNRSLDGVNLWPALMGDQAARRQLAERPWFSYHGQAGPDQEHLAMMQSGWKLKVNGPVLKNTRQLNDKSTSVELFRLKDDPFEKQDLASKHPQRVQKMAQRLIEYRSLQPAEAVPPYGVGKDGFVPPPKWEVNPQDQETLLGKD